ncbi:MAG: hypothetical protein U9Q81_20255 [Pseudomonadota bacterium]|nr:hypothetical protein [Pseudomonadota bacterium]
MEPNEPVALSFFCELDGQELESLFSDPAVISRLLDLQAGVSLGILDFGDQRAGVVRRLNRAGIPVIAWQLLPRDQGYWYNIRNASQAQARYREFRSWSAAQELEWAGLGVDIEPDIGEFQQLLDNHWRLLPMLFKRRYGKKQLQEARRRYFDLIAEMRGDGFLVESYELPFIVNELRAGSTLLRRILGITDVPADRRVLMLYTSFFRPYGQAFLWRYARDADTVGVGITGGGVDMNGAGHLPPLDWAELARDLRLAGRWCRDIHIFSLEGCVRQGHLERLKGFDWEQPAQPPRHWLVLVYLLRAGLQTALWLSARSIPGKRIGTKDSIAR